MKTLVIEDNRATRLLLRQQLIALGSEVETVADLPTAKQAIASSSFDLILLDGHLGDCGVHEVAALVSSGKLDSGTRLIAITASTTEQELDEWHKAGVWEVWEKPVSLEHLHAAVQQLEVSALAQRSSSQFRGAAHAPLPIVNQELFGKLVKMTETGGVDKLHGIIDIFRSSSEQRVTELRQAIAQRNTDRVKKICHSWLGIAASLGAEQLAGSIQQIRQCAIIEDFHDCQVEMQKMLKIFAATQHWFAEHLAASTQ